MGRLLVQVRPRAMESSIEENPRIYKATAAAGRGLAGPFKQDLAHKLGAEIGQQ